LCGALGFSSTSSSGLKEEGGLGLGLGFFFFFFLGLTGSTCTSTLLLDNTEGGRADEDDRKDL
jgi:hypothetical protein